MLVAHAVSPYNPLRLAAPSAPATTSRFLFFRINKLVAGTDTQPLPDTCQFTAPISDIQLMSTSVTLSKSKSKSTRVYSSLLYYLVVYQVTCAQ